MALVPVFAGIAAVVSALLYTSLTGTNRYVPNACSNVATFLPARVVGQDMAIRHLVNAVCEHIREPPDGRATRSRHGAGPGAAGSVGPPPILWARRKPLVISVHGPPGTGKTYTHTLLARALYNRDPVTAMSCPGEGCSGAKVLYGLNFVAEEQDSQLAQVRAAILEHIRSTPNPMLVIEEYDKLDCASRGMLRQLIRHPELANTDLSRAIILLESNLGFLELEKLLGAVKGNKSQIPPEAAERVLRHAALHAWRAAECETIDDSVSFAATIDHYLPFFPLTREDIATLVERELSSNYATRAAALGGTLVLEPAVVKWLVHKVDYDGGDYPLEGAAQVEAVCVRFVAHLFRTFEKDMHTSGHGGGLKAGVHASSLGAMEFRLALAPGATELQLLRTDVAPPQEDGSAEVIATAHP